MLSFLRKFMNCMATDKTFYELYLEKISESYKLPEYQYMQLRQSKAFMTKYLSDKIALSHLAAAACISKFHYIRLFQRVYGVTPRQYLKDLRICKAKELLKTGTPVTRACIEVGYDSLPSFSSAFRKGIGMSPRAYYKLHNSNPQ